MDDSIMFYIQKLTREPIFIKIGACQNFGLIKSHWWPPVATGLTDRPMSGAKTCGTKF